MNGCVEEGGCASWACVEGGETGKREGGGIVMKGRTLVLWTTDSGTIGLICSSCSVVMVAREGEFSVPERNADWVDCVCPLGSLEVYGTGIIGDVVSERLFGGRINKFPNRRGHPCREVSIEEDSRNHCMARLQIDTGDKKQNRINSSPYM